MGNPREPRESDDDATLDDPLGERDEPRDSFDELLREAVRTRDVADAVVRARLRTMAGLVIAERYQLAEVLGVGTFGEVWRARDTRLMDREVAVKFVKPQFLDDAAVVDRFEREAQALAALRHDNVVGVLDRGEANGLRFFVMELVAGQSLVDWIAAHEESGRATDLAMVRAIHDRVCAGVAAAHEVRMPGPIVHRDIKPANVVFRDEGRAADVVVKVLDFGIAQLGARAQTVSGTWLGTPAYMAPEQAAARASQTGPWTDVFALGVLLVEMLTLAPSLTAAGDALWTESTTRPETLRVQLGALRTDVPPAVWDVLTRALAADPARRHATAGVLRTELAAAWESTSSSSERADDEPDDRDLGHRATQPATPTPAAATTMGDVPAVPMRVARWPLVIALVAGIAVISTAGWWLYALTKP